MSRQDFKKGRVSFCDIAACFSEEEWNLLHEWQKELYRTVMKEIQQALVSLGPLIATAVFSLNAAEKEEQYPVERRHVHNDSFTGTKVANPEASARENREKSFCLKNPQERRQEGNYCLRTGEGSPLHNDSVLRVEDKTNVSVMDHHGAELEEYNAEAHTVISLEIKEEDDLYIVDPPHPERTKIPNRSTGDPVPTTSHPQILERKQETYFEKQQVSLLQERNTCKGSGARKREARNSALYVENTTEQKASYRKAEVNADESTKTLTYSQSPLWLESNQDLRDKETALHERSSMHAEPSTFYQGISNSEGLDTYNDGEINLWNSDPACQPSSPVAVRPFACPECDKRFKTKQHLTRHQRTHSGERPYHCTDCEKSFSLKHHLIGHRRTHTGERPYQCTECGKRFSLKGNLSHHQRTHMGTYDTSQRGGIIPGRNLSNSD